MKKLSLFIALTSMAVAPNVRADAISYTLTSLGGDNWAYSYTVTNTDEVAGLYVFDIYFPSVSSANYLSYSNITEIANPDPTNWQTTIFPPSAPNLGAFYDAFALKTPIALDQALSGFRVSFTYSGTAALGTQGFEIYDSNFNLLETSSTAPTSSVPEPSTLGLSLLGAGLLGLLATTRRAKTHR